jgi:hypothetical protein
MTVLQRAKQVWPGLSESDLKIALWSLTTYPSGKETDVLDALRSAYIESDGNLLQALQRADEAIVKMQTLGG